MADEYNLQRFIDAQKDTYAVALSEIKKGRKQSHWMWYIFPQVRGLGFSATSKLYGIKDIYEAEAYLQHPLLGSRLVEISKELQQLKINNAHTIFGSPDDMKLHSSMTLFSSLHNADPIFSLVLEKFFKGKKDEKTLGLL